MPFSSQLAPYPKPLLTGEETLDTQSRSIWSTTIPRSIGHSTITTTGAKKPKDTNMEKVKKTNSASLLTLPSKKEDFLATPSSPLMDGATSNILPKTSVANVPTISVQSSTIGLRITALM